MQTGYEVIAKEPLGRIAQRVFQQLRNLAGFLLAGCRNCAVEAALIPEPIETPHIALRTAHRRMLPLHLLQNLRQLLCLQAHDLRRLRLHQNHHPHLPTR